jgi:hypothetical protein
MRLLLKECLGRQSSIPLISSFGKPWQQPRNRIKDIFSERAPWLGPLVFPLDGGE